MRPWGWSRAAALLAALAAAAPTSAVAQVILRDQGSSPYETPQHFGLELRFGPYTPNIDSEFADRGSARTPYKDYFGSDDDLMTQVELDYQFLRGVGSLGVGLTAGYFSNSARAFQADGSRSGDETTLLLLPFSLSLVYRFDLLAERERFPLIPYAKLGLDYTYWSVKDGNGKIARDDAGNRARGGSTGWHAAAGVSLLLDVFEPDSARSLDSEIGVNHTHIFVEVGHFAVSSFGKAGALRVGDTTWFAGVLFEL